MKNLSNLLDRFKNSLNKNSAAKETVARVIKNKTNINLTTDNIHIKDGVLFISSSPSINNEIRLKEEGIKSELVCEYKIKISKIVYK